MDNKPKPKNVPGAVRRFQAGLFVWMILTFLAATYPPLWLVPPYMHLTPFIYIGISLLWIPFAVRHMRRFGLRGLTMVLMVGCLLVTGVMAKNFVEINPWLGSSCPAIKDQPSRYVCNRGCYEGDDEPIMGYSIFERQGNLPIMILVDYVNGLMGCF